MLLLCLFCLSAVFLAAAQNQEQDKTTSPSRNPIEGPKIFRYYAIHFTAPPQFGGLEGRWTPEDRLMTALASCFTTTFHAIAGRSKSNTRTWLWKRKEPSVKRTMAIASARLSFVPA